MYVHHRQVKFTKGFRPKYCTTLVTSVKCELIELCFYSMKLTCNDARARLKKAVRTRGWGERMRVQMCDGSSPLRASHGFDVVFAYAVFVSSCTRSCRQFPADNGRADAHRYVHRSVPMTRR